MINKLRIGICGCTDLYHRELIGSRWIVNRVGGECVIPRPTFELAEEICIPERNYDAALLTHRCHFFVDKHMENYMPNPHFTIASLCEYMPYTRTGEEGLFIGWGFQKVWRTKTPITTHRLLAGMRDILMQMKIDDLYGWLIHLTPNIDPRPLGARQEPFRTFRSRAIACREERLYGQQRYHCYPACTSNPCVPL